MSEIRIVFQRGPSSELHGLTKVTQLYFHPALLHAANIYYKPALVKKAVLGVIHREA